MMANEKVAEEEAEAILSNLKMEGRPGLRKCSIIKENNGCDVICDMYFDGNQ